MQRCLNITFGKASFEFRSSIPTPFIRPHQVGETMVFFFCQWLPMFMYIWRAMPSSTVHSVDTN